MRACLMLGFLAVAACRSAPEASPATRPAFKWIAYDRPTSTLSIQFNDGSRSNFSGVAETTYTDFIRAGDKRAFFMNSIQGHYEGRAEP